MGNQRIHRTFPVSRPSSPAGRPAAPRPGVARVEAASPGVTLAQRLIRAERLGHRPAKIALQGPGLEGPAAVQRSIQVKDGKKYNQLSKAIEAPRFRAIVESPAVYLVNSEDDLKLMREKKDAPVLAPRKHLIGENHTASEFTKAVRDWAWGAAMLIEPYADHKTLVDTKQEELKKAPRGDTDEEKTMWARASALEDAAAKSLANLVHARIHVALLEENALKLPPLPRQTQVIETIRTLQPDLLPTLRKMSITAWNLAWPAFRVAEELIRYLGDSAAHHAKGFILVRKYFKEHELVRSAFKDHGDLVSAMGAGLDNIKAQIDHPETLPLDSSKVGGLLERVDQLIPVLQRLIVAYDPQGFPLSDLKEATESAIQSDEIQHLHPLRERYMRQRIEAAGVPALVKIGARHVANLRPDLPAQTLAYDDYAAFQAKNTADRVDV